MPSSAFVFTEFGVVAFSCFFLVRYYALSTITWDVMLAVYLSWVLGLSLVLILPYDLSIALVENDRSPLLEDVWRFVYWSTFFLAWVVLPLQMEYHSSGHFSFKEKLYDSVYRLLLTGLIAVAAGVVYVIWMVSSTGGSLSEVVGFVMAMGNTYGILLITLLMGNGLVALPMNLWYLGDADRELKDLYLSAAGVEEGFHDARYELEDCEVEIAKAVAVVGRDSTPMHASADMVGTLHTKATAFEFSKRSRAHSYRGAGSLDRPLDDAVLTSKTHLVALHARLMAAQLRARASERRWRDLVVECQRQQEITEGGVGDASVQGDTPSPGPHTPSITSVLWQPWTWEVPQACRPTCKALHVLFFRTLFTRCVRVLAVITALFSAMILWCELMMSSNLHSPVGLMMTAYSYQESSSVMVQGVAFTALAYMSICTYWPLFRLNIGFAYKLQGPQQSSPSSLIFNAEYLSRLQFAIGYNFLMYVNVPRASNTAFNDLMSNMELIPVFGTSFAVYIPLIMLLVALLTLFDGYGRIVKLLGVEMEDSPSRGNGLSCLCGPDPDDPQLEEQLRTGKLIITNELKQWRAAAELAAPRAPREARTMRIGMTNITDALIGNKYKNLDSTPPDMDVDLDEGAGGGLYGRGSQYRSSGSIGSIGSIDSISSNLSPATHARRSYAISKQKIPAERRKGKVEEVEVREGATKGNKDKELSDSYNGLIYKHRSALTWQGVDKASHMPNTGDSILAARGDPRWAGRTLNMYRPWSSAREEDVMDRMLRQVYYYIDSAF
mmetsp:Transcript_5899/g.13016  ORF Transcript_5899/g.13016 Transcript_5899/m.13016 type:complete len:780 (-) Transcript_5899:165-2504(-)